jgi:hypothetical protein
VPDPNDPDLVRFDLQPSGVINIGDLNSLITSAPGGTARPPMFGLQQAFFANAGNGIGVCPWEPGTGPAAGSPIGSGGGKAGIGAPIGESSTEGPLGGAEAGIDQISIDTGPPGPLRALVTNGRPAAGDRDGDTVADAEGYDTPDPGDEPGVCGNGLDDDRADTDGDTVPDGPLDGVADDGCQVALTVRETCINVIDDGIKNADEDAVVAGQDRAMVDITVGQPPPPVEWRSSVKADEFVAV